MSTSLISCLFPTAASQNFFYIYFLPSAWNTPPPHCPSLKSLTSIPSCHHTTTIMLKHLSGVSLTVNVFLWKTSCDLYCCPSYTEFYEAVRAPTHPSLARVILMHEASVTCLCPGLGCSLSRVWLTVVYNGLVQSVVHQLCSTDSRD